MALRIFSNRNLKALALLAVSGLIVFWVASAPHPFVTADIPAHTANLENGKLLYNIGGCISCHVSETDAQAPSGGKAFATPIGVLYPPNLTPDPETGLGKWSDVDFVNAMQKGLSPEGAHLIPAFPYTS